MEWTWVRVFSIVLMNAVFAAVVAVAAFIVVDFIFTSIVS